VESFHIQPLGPGDRARFVESWRGVQARFVDGPGGAVTEADISLDHPLVLEHYRSAHGIAARQTQGQASTEDLRQAMIHYRTLFEELVGEPELARTKTA
jgi:hypothetical protein